MVIHEGMRDDWTVGVVILSTMRGFSGSIPSTRPGYGIVLLHYELQKSSTGIWEE